MLSASSGSCLVAAVRRARFPDVSEYVYVGISVWVGRRVERRQSGPSPRRLQPLSPRFAMLYL